MSYDNNHNRRTGYNDKRLTALAAASVFQVFGPNPNRAALVLGGTSAGQSITYGFNDQLVNGQGIWFVGNTAPIVLTREMIGDVIENPVFAIASGAVAFCAAEIIYLDTKPL